MTFKFYSKMALLALAASLMFSGCGGKTDDATMSDHLKNADGTAVASGQEGDASVNGETSSRLADGSSNAAASSESMVATGLVTKPSTNSVYFSFDSSKVDSAGSSILAEYATWLNANPNVSITVEGNCDERGSREYNLALGDERAKSVRDALIANGVAGTRVDTVSFGEERSVCTGAGEACWAQNRHGDIVNR